MSAAATLKVIGGDGQFTIDAKTGVIVSRDYTDSPEYDAIHSFVPCHVSTPYDPQEMGEIDICYIGAWTKSGKYEPPAVFERPHNPAKMQGAPELNTIDGEIWEAHHPRFIPLKP